MLNYRTAINGNWPETWGYIWDYLGNLGEIGILSWFDHRTWGYTATDDVTRLGGCRGWWSHLTNVCGKIGHQPVDDLCSNCIIRALWNGNISVFVYGPFKQIQAWYQHVPHGIKWVAHVRFWGRALERYRSHQRPSHRVSLGGSD
jgi:hypothetical protein